VAFGRHRDHARKAGRGAWHQRKEDDMQDPVTALVDIQLAAFHLATLNGERAMQHWMRSVKAQAYLLSGGSDGTHSAADPSHGDRARPAGR
jgi:hypothetical protein